MLNNCLKASPCVVSSFVPWGAETFKQKISDFIQSLTQKELSSISCNKLLNHFENHIIKFAKEIDLCEVCNHPDWFAQSETILSELIIARNLAHKQYTTTKTTAACEHLKTTRRV